MTTINKPKFTILDKDKKSPVSLIHCFMEVMRFDTDNTPSIVKASNGAEYEAVYDNFIIDKKTNVQKVIVSFQKHTHGKYAVIRNFKEKARN